MNLESGHRPADWAVAQEVSEDSLLNGRIRLLQPVAGYRVAIDPIFLAAGVPVLRGDTVLDLGCGVGAAGLCLLHRVPDIVVTGLDIQADLVALAAQNALENHCAERYRPMVGDVCEPPSELIQCRFDHVLCNPPHLPEDQSRPSGNPQRDVANREGTACLSNWVAAALAMVRSKGSVTFVHRADRLDALLAALHDRSGEVVVFPLWPHPDKPAKRVVVRARKDVAGPLRLAAGLVLHGPDGQYTADAQAILRDGEALPL